MSAALGSLLSLLVVLPLAGSGDLSDAGLPDGGVEVVAPFQLHARVVPAKVKLGEPFTLELTITHDPNQRYELKTPGDLGDFDLEATERRRVDGKDQSTTTLEVKLAAFALGVLDTPPLELEVTAPEGLVSLPAPRTKIEVVSSLPPDADQKGENLYDVRAPEEVPIRSWRLLYALAAIVATLLLAWAIIRWARRPKPVVAAPLPPPEPLHTRAIKALDGLAAQGLPAKGEFKAYYFRLSEIVRGYLGELYGIEALESTTSELLVALHNRHTPGLPLKDFVSFAEQSDFIRYAKLQPTLEDCKNHLELGYRIVHATHAAAQQSAGAPRPPT